LKIGLYIAWLNNVVSEWNIFVFSLDDFCLRQSSSVIYVFLPVPSLSSSTLKEGRVL